MTNSEKNHLFNQYYSYFIRYRDETDVDFYNRVIKAASHFTLDFSKAEKAIIRENNKIKEDTKPKIGDRVYLLDNSYTYNITDDINYSKNNAFKDHPFLAGSNNSPKKICILISKPNNIDVRPYSWASSIDRIENKLNEIIKYIINLK